MHVAELHRLSGSAASLTQSKRNLRDALADLEAEGGHAAFIDKYDIVRPKPAPVAGAFGTLERAFETLPREGGFRDAIAEKTISHQPLARAAVEHSLRACAREARWIFDLII